MVMAMPAPRPIAAVVANLAQRQWQAGRFALLMLQEENGGGDKNRRGQPERQSVPNQHDAEGNAQCKHQQDAHLLGAVDFGLAGGRQQMRPPAARGEQRAQDGHGDPEQSRQQAGDGVGVDALLFEPVHHDGPDQDGDAQRHPAESGKEIAAQGGEVLRA